MLAKHTGGVQYGRRSSIQQRGFGGNGGETHTMFARDKTAANSLHQTSTFAPDANYDDLKGMTKKKRKKRQIGARMGQHANSAYCSLQNVKA